MRSFGFSCRDCTGASARTWKAPQPRFFRVGCNLEPAERQSAGADGHGWQGLPGYCQRPDAAGGFERLGRADGQTPDSGAEGSSSAGQETSRSHEEEDYGRRGRR